MIKYIQGYYKLEWSGNSKWFKCLYQAEVYAKERGIVVDITLDKINP